MTDTTPTPAPEEPTTVSLLADVAERTLWTWAESFLGLLIAAPMFADGLVDLSVVETAAVAGIPAALAVVKGFAASRIGKRDTASTLRR